MANRSALRRAEVARRGGPPIGGDTTSTHLSGSCAKVRQRTPGTLAQPQRTTLAHPSARLLALAGEVERLGNDARGGAEGFVVGKLTIAKQLRQMAHEMESTG